MHRRGQAFRLLDSLCHIVLEPLYGSLRTGLTFTFDAEIKFDLRLCPGGTGAEPAVVFQREAKDVGRRKAIEPIRIILALQNLETAVGCLWVLAQFIHE